MDSDDTAALMAELFQGVPNDIAVSEIATKLSRKDAASLSLVSRTWRQAIESRVVYSARVRSHSIETLVILRIFDNRNKFNGLCLYSVREKTLSRLPPIPIEVFSRYQFIAVDGRLYILGGTGGQQNFQNMYVLDLAGQGRWKQCASMLEPRKRFGCGALDGKIYVFGGTSAVYKGNSGFDRCEMYDPKVNTWVAIKPLPRQPALWRSPRVVSVGEELYLLDWTGDRTSHWHVYHPLRDEWRVEAQLKTECMAAEYLRSPYFKGVVQTSFTAQGKFYKISEGNFRVYNAENNSWTPRCSKLCHPAGSIRGTGVLHFILPVGDELLALGMWRNDDDFGDAADNQYVLLQSNGFSNQDKNEFVWEILPYVFTSQNVRYGSMCTVEL